MTSAKRRATATERKLIAHLNEDGFERLVLRLAFASQETFSPSTKECFVGRSLDLILPE
jgi:hypothetical protein